MKLYVIIVLDPEEGPYVASDNTCTGDAFQTASEVSYETGHRAIVRCIEINENILPTSTTIVEYNEKEM